MSEKQYVVFRLNKEHFGVDIEDINEITEGKHINKIPNAPEFIEGLTNLRGEVIPLVNLKKRFNIESDENTSKRIIVTSIFNKKVGFIVDDASETISIDEKNIDPVPDVLAGSNTEYITGIGKLEDRILIILNLEKILSPKERNEAFNISTN